MNYISKFLFGALGFLISVALQAEPWLSNRMAQNCAGCHAPSRRNVVPIERRCTLSCQGCHVNPNGGGIRNQYGIWNSERWLRSFYVAGLGHKRSPAPLKHQKYANQPAGGNKSVPSIGHPLVASRSPHPPEKLYDKSDLEWQKTVKNKREFMERATREDPYRLERTEKVYVGGSYRFLNIFDRSEGASPKQVSFPMSFDLGARIRPIPENISIVVEQRFLQGPGTEKNLSRQHERLFTDPSSLRSAYVLVDDLMYNTYVMYGLFKPQFGHDSPDHTALHQIYKGLSQRSHYRVLTVGTAPNVPFLYVHKIFPEVSATEETSGWVTNLGGRFVTLGLSFMLSYWDTSSKNQAGTTLNRKMVSLTGGAYVWDTVINWEYLYVKQEFEPGKFDAGNVYTTEFKHRFWRENYVTANYSISDIAVNLKQGASEEVRMGIKSFLISGTELDFSYGQKVLNYSGVADAEVEKSFMLSAHLFY